MQVSNNLTVNNIMHFVLKALRFNVTPLRAEKSCQNDRERRPLLNTPNVQYFHCIINIYINIMVALLEFLAYEQCAVHMVQLATLWNLWWQGQGSNMFSDSTSSCISACGSMSVCL